MAEKLIQKKTVSIETVLLFQEDFISKKGGIFLIES